MSKNKPPGQVVLIDAARSAREKMLAEGGVVPLWKLPREFLPHGTKLFANPEQLWQAAVEYFEWCVNNPVEYENEVGRNTGIFAKIKKPRPFHIKALRAFCGISASAWRNLCAMPEFDDVICEIEDVIYTQKFDHAMVGVYDAGMSSKELGLSDKKEISGPNGGEIQIGSPAKEILMARLVKPPVDDDA